MVGTVLANRFEIAGLVSDGPIFSAYSARDRTNGRDVLVRVAKPPFGTHPGFLEALQSSSQRYGSIKSQMIETISEVGQDGDAVYYVTDLTRGPTLADRIRKLAPFSIPVSVATGISICQALEPLHRQTLAHGDLNPQNIVVLANGDVKLELTGVWEVYSASPTAGAMVLPSMAPYLSPEVSAGTMPSPTSDVYALGVLLYELLTGRLPYYGDTPVAIALAHANSATPSVRAINLSVPAVLDEIIKKAMAKDPHERYVDSADMLGDLRLLQDALRFGRSLNWPIRATAGGANPTAKPAKSGERKAAEPQPVAPRMSAVRSDEEYESSRRRARQERDVPVWMTMIIVFLAAVVLSLIGVWMLMNLNRPELVAIPNVVGLTKEEATAMLKDSKLESKMTKLPSERVEMNRVITVSPPVGEKVRQGSRVTVTLSSGSRVVAVPDLKGLTLDKARTILENLNLKVDPNIVQQNDSNVESGHIIATKPASKARVARDSPIQFIVSTGSSGAPTPDISAQGGGYLYTVRLPLDNLTEATAVKIDMSDSRGRREIFNEMRSPGDVIEISEIGPDKQATFTVYYNDEKVVEKTQSASGPGGQ